MVTHLHRPEDKYPTPPEIIYPESDGQPMADNAKQFRWIVVIKEGLEWLFQADPDEIQNSSQCRVTH